MKKLLILLFIFLNLSISAIAQICFKPSNFYTIPNNNNLLSISSADLNKDGNKDLIVPDNGLFLVMAGDGNGSFAPPVADTIMQSILNIAIADFNNDGYEDIVGTTYNTLLKIWFGDSSLSLIDSTIIPAVVKDIIDVGDFNKDGNMDFITNDRDGWMNLTGNILTLYSGNGAGSFTPSTINVGNSVLNINYFRVSDFNKDGYSDIAFYEGSNGVVIGPNPVSQLTILMNDTLGSFNSTVYNSPVMLGKFALGDLNNDGLMDIVATATDSITNVPVNGVLTFINNGSGFTKQFNPSEIPGGSISLADFDGDGYLDISTRNTSYLSENIASISINNGNASFSKVTSYDTESTNLLGGTGVGPYVCADMNNDSIPDLSLINYSNTNNIAIKIGSHSMSNILTGFSNLSCANILDGSIYLQASGSGSPYTYSWNTGQTSDSLTQLPAAIYFGTVTSSDGCQASYVNFLSEPSPIYMYTYNTNLSCSGTSSNLNSIVNIYGGTPPFQYNFDHTNWTVSNQATNLTTGTHYVVTKDSSNCKDSISFNLSIPAGINLSHEYFSKHDIPLKSVYADFNVDGFKDIATLYRDSSILYVYLNNSGNAFSPPIKYKYSNFAPTNFFQLELHVADVTGDNIPDLLIVDNKVILCVGNGTGGFASSSTLISSPSSSIALGDFDNDLKTDFMLSSVNNTILRFYKGNNAGGFTFFSSFTLSQMNTYSTRSMESIDVNNDGNLDLLIAASKFMVLMGNGTGGFAAPVIYNSTPFRSKLLVKDINFDGFPDVTIGGNSTVSQFLGSASGTYTLANSITTTRSIYDLAIGDMNNDNLTDIVAATIAGVEIHLADTLSSSPTIITEPFYSNILFVEDYNYDGNLDIIDQLADSIYLKVYQNCLPLGIQNNPLTESISIYPNPTQSIINISLPEKLLEKNTIVIYDIHGRALIQQKFNATVSLNVESLSSGFYTVLVANSKHTYRGKFVKNN